MCGAASLFAKSFANDPMKHASRLTLKTPKITERHLQELVRKAAIINGYKFFHVWNSVHSPKGWPDCILVKNGRMLCVELKSETGAVTQDQQDWLDALGRVPGVEVQVLRPSGFDKFFEELRREEDAYRRTTSRLSQRA
jgi:hypothetical protein